MFLFKLTSLPNKRNIRQAADGSLEAKAMHEHIRPASKANKKKVGSNHCPPQRVA